MATDKQPAFTMVEGARCSTKPNGGMVFPFADTAGLEPLTVKVSGAEMYVLYSYGGEDENPGVAAVESSGFWLYAVDALSKTFFEELELAAHAVVEREQREARGEYARMFSDAFPKFPSVRGAA